MNSKGLKAVLVEQYLLHEAPHHPTPPEGSAGTSAVVPRAHTLADIYKCLHQGTFGVGHSIRDPEEFGRRLLGDLLQAKPVPDEPILESVSSSGEHLRLNLRPYRRLFLGDDTRAAAQLLAICLDSAEAGTGNEKGFLEDLERFAAINNGLEISAGGSIFAFHPDQALQFVLQVRDFIARTQAVPVLSHSPQYKWLNAPSYRVVCREVLKHSPLAFLLEEEK